MKGYRTKRIPLPGGRVIEIVLFADEGEEHPPEDDLLDVLDIDPPRGATAYPMNHCPECHSDLVYPVAWEESAEDCWLIERRCPNCEWRETDEFHQTEVEEFDDALNDGTEDLLASLRQFSRANMESDVEKMITALDGDHIHPMDF